MNSIVLQRLDPDLVPGCLARTWVLYKMVAHFTMRTYELNQAFRFVEGIWIHRKSRQIRKKRKRLILHHLCTTYSELPSYISIMS